LSVSEACTTETGGAGWAGAAGDTETGTVGGTETGMVYASTLDTGGAGACGTETGTTETGVTETGGTGRWTGTGT
jgi:hypothetical protein